MPGCTRKYPLEGFARSCQHRETKDQTPVPLECSPVVRINSGSHPSPCLRWPHRDHFRRFWVESRDWLIPQSLCLPQSFTPISVMFYLSVRRSIRLCLSVWLSLSHTHPALPDTYSLVLLPLSTWLSPHPLDPTMNKQVAPGPQLCLASLNLP